MIAVLLVLVNLCDSVRRVAAWTLMGIDIASAFQSSPTAAAPHNAGPALGIATVVVPMQRGCRGR
jgi:hypothetical protein